MDNKILELPEIKDKSIKFAHFPTRMQAFIFKNWHIVPKERIAMCLKCSVKNVERKSGKLRIFN